MENKPRRRVAYSKGTIVIAVMTALGLAAIGAVEFLTRGQILENQRQQQLAVLHQVFPAAAHDNDLLNDYLEFTDEELLGSNRPLRIHLAKNSGHVVGIIVPVVAPDGYQGRIRLLLGLRADGTLLNVRIIEHIETPGLGDQIHQDVSDWVFGFSGLSLGTVPTEDWRVKRDGGRFDQFTGATVSPRATVKAIHNALLFVEANKSALLSSE